MACASSTSDRAADRDDSRHPGTLGVDEAGRRRAGRARCRVITFSLADEPRPAAASTRARVRLLRGPGRRGDGPGRHRARGDLRRLLRGLVAAAFAARHPDRAAALILVSALPPCWTPDRARRVLPAGPAAADAALLLASLRLYHEIAAARPGSLRAPWLGARHGLNALTRTCSRRHAWPDGSRCSSTPNLDDRAASASTYRRSIVTGEDGLDRVVTGALTREYLRSVAARGAVTLDAHRASRA